ncbi:MAG: hypothetical protein ACTJLK_01065 [Anaplasma sp.]
MRELRMFDVEIAVGEYNLRVSSANIDESGYFNTCACSGDGEGPGRRVEGVWSPTALVLSVANGDSGGCTDCKQQSTTPVEINNGSLYIFDTYSGDQEIEGKHSVFEGPSGAMTFLLNGTDGDAVEFITPPATARVTFTKTVEIEEAGPVAVVPEATESEAVGTAPKTESSAESGNGAPHETHGRGASGGPSHASPVLVSSAVSSSAGAPKEENSRSSGGGQLTDSDGETSKNGEQPSTPVEVEQEVVS